jgi:hypothetical protein
MELSGVPAFVLLAVLPGAWLSFGLSLPGTGVAVRVWLAVALSPVVVAVQFYALRLAGLPFRAVVVLLLIGNVAAAVPLVRRLRSLGARAPWPPSIAAGLVWGVPLALLASLWSDRATAAVSAHAFLHSDIVYAIANGGLRLEEAQLAGLTLGYPWGGHVHQAVTSSLLGMAPSAAYPLTNLLWLVAAVALIAHVTGALGGTPRARLIAVVALVFGVNAAGYVIATYVLPEAAALRLPIWGDERYTPWLRKYLFWSQHPFAHALFAGCIYVVATVRQQRLPRGAFILLLALGVGLAFVYPPLVPPLLALIAARLVVAAMQDRAGATTLARQLSIAAMLVALATAIVLRVIALDRHAGIGLGFSDAWNLKIKLAESVVVLAPLGVAVLLALVRRAAADAVAAWTLVLAAAGSAGLYALFSVPPGRNEYKFVLTAAMCLAPLAALGADAFLARGGRWRAALAGTVLLGVVGSGVHALTRERGSGSPDPVLRLNAFRVTLDSAHHQAASLATVATRTPTNTIVLVDSSDVHVPTFTQRAMFAPPLMNVEFRGVGLRTLELLESVRGYGADAVAQRQAVARQFFQARAAHDRMDALRAIQSLRRRVGVLLEQQRQRTLTQLLADSAGGTILHRDARWAVWFWSPADTGIRTAAR